MSNKIKTGDKVSVRFYGAGLYLSHDADVISVPVATGDSWVFKDNRSGRVHYVSEGCTITKIGEEV